ncbi:hypothetical protein C2G38_2246220 [Gigaspora rosea]|uniref:Uncharacterized protein n=1 Tax=Gigaspora rosea TaxID=44941 RepID=A0A397V736_9GLOM|nr:hypothetical protein C2G38_2246220 [Gigaspora rosea]
MPPKRTSKEQKLADNNQKGIGIEKDKCKTFELYLKDDEIRTSKEQKLADNNQKGIGIEKSERKTFELYPKDDEMGLITA